MPFSGGGSNILKAHQHTTAVQDGGTLDMDNVTQAGLTAGDIVYSDGNALQRLAIGSNGGVLTIDGATATPYWTNNFQWDQTTGGQTITMQLGSQEAVQEFQTGFEIMGYKITKIEWSVRRNSGTGNNLSFRCEIVDSGCVVQDTIGSDYDASTVGAVFEYITFTGSATNYAITNTDMMRLKLVDDGGGSGADNFSSELCASCTIANTRGGYDNGACVQTWYATRNTTCKVTYAQI